MLKTWIERIARRVAEEYFARQSEQLRTLHETMVQARSDLNKLDTTALEARVESLESAFEGIAGDWTLAKQQLKRLHGQLTKAAAIDARNGAPAESQLETADDVIAFARARGLTR